MLCIAPSYNRVHTSNIGIIIGVFANGVKMVRVAYVKIFVALLVAGIIHVPAATARDGDMIWTLSQAGAGSAQLRRQVPETDNVQVSATCGPDSPDNATSFIISVDTGELKNGSQTRIRFSGGGNEYELPGRALIPNSEEGLQGVEIVISHEHALWDAFVANESLAYQIPGYQSQTLPLAGGQQTIRNYVKTCRHLAAGSGSSVAAPTKSEGAKEAFAAARELDTVEGYQAFIKAFPTGFYADLATAHLKKLNREGVAAQPSQATQPSGQKKQASTGSCRRGQIRVDGKCMTPADAVGFCGPGYRVYKNKCVHQDSIPKKSAKKKKKKNAKMLKRNEGGYISVADCNRKGMIPEFGYCVEND